MEEFFSGQLEALPEGWDQEPQQTLSFHRVLQRAVIHAQSAERKEINGGNLLIAMYREPDSYAVYLLEEQGITRFDVVNYVSHGVSKIATEEEPEAPAEEEQDERGTAGATGESAGGLYSQPGRQSGAGQYRSADRPRRRDRADDSRAMSPAQK